MAQSRGGGKTLFPSNSLYFLKKWGKGLKRGSGRLKGPSSQLHERSVEEVLLEERK